MDGTTTQYAYDGVRLLKELDANGATQMTYTLAPLGDEWYPLVSDRASGASRFYAFDALGTTRALTADSQLPTAVWTDDAYGNLLSATDPAATPHQYLGKLGYYTDAASGLQLLTQRYYDPAVGRFVTQDPIRDGSNWFQYVGSAPSVNADPSGLQVGELEACHIMYELAHCHTRQHRMRMACEAACGWREWMAWWWTGRWWRWLQNGVGWSPEWAMEFPYRGHRFELVCWNETYDDQGDMKTVWVEYEPGRWVQCNCMHVSMPLCTWRETGR